MQHILHLGGAACMPRQHHLGEGAHSGARSKTRMGSNSTQQAWVSPRLAAAQAPVERPADCPLEQPASASRIRGACLPQARDARRPLLAGLPVSPPRARPHRHQVFAAGKAALAQRGLDGRRQPGLHLRTMSRRGRGRMPLASQAAGPRGGSQHGPRTAAERHAAAGQRAP